MRQEIQYHKPQIPNKSQLQNYKRTVTGICNLVIRYYLGFGILVFVPFLYAVVPLSTSPSWTSNDQDYSTGGGFADINNDGYIDFCTSNGNDMAINKQGIYFNTASALETQASWRSADSGYFGHLYLGDVDNDGNIDMSVSFLGLGTTNQGKTRIYKNQGTSLNPTPDWLSSDQYNSFDNCLGDVDLDGDLDLAVAAGDEYNNIRSPARIYRNNNGVFETTPYWSSLDSTPSDCIRFADINRDGYLDLIVGYHYKLAVFYNQNGLIQPTASWSVSEQGWIIRLAPADYDNDGWIDLAIAINGQLGTDSSRIKVYKNNQGQLNTQASYTMLKNRHYCSCVAWGDANGDGYLDLAAGGWWETAVVFENHNGILDTLPGWSWGGSSLVCEALVWGDIRNFHLKNISDTFFGNGTRKLFYTSKSPLHKLLAVYVQRNPVPVSNYCYDPLAGWFVLPNAPAVGETVILVYSFSSNPDLAVTNWTRLTGNLLFFNTTPQATEEEYSGYIKERTCDLVVTPNPFFSQSKFDIGSNRGIIKIYNHSGSLVKILSSQPYIWNGSDKFGNELPSGIYFVKAIVNNKIITKKIIKLK
jgi:hypothetical protein